ncbi:MAG TPA: KOW motif-containing protein [Pyrinomonadaceae bacterium]|nr:KOW motif-containing protein [Pyrinomonadaceae bacterium]
MNTGSSLSVGDMVRIRAGAFQNFRGRIEEVDKQQATLKVRVEIFGRPEPIELRFVDVEKISFTEEE